MANLDVITLKHIVQDDEVELIKQLMGEGSSDGSLPQKIEAGELVIRRMRGFIELWSMDQGNEPAKIEVNTDDIEVDFDPEWLENIGLGDLYDVDLQNGVSGDLGPGSAGMVLTWDGAVWAPRNPPGLETGAISTLDFIGDVNYAHFAAINKFGPEANDVLVWEYNAELLKYEWAPRPFDFDTFPNVAVRSRMIVIQKSVYNGFRFGNIVTDDATSADFKFSDNGATVELNVSSAGGNYHQRFTLGASKSTLTLAGGLELSWEGQGRDEGTSCEGIYFKEEDHAPEPRTLYHLPSMLQVRNDWPNMELGNIGNVNDAGILQGQVLMWDSIQQMYIPSSGVAPDLSLGSVGDLNDVETAGAVNWDQLIFDGDQQKWTARIGWQRYEMPESYPDGWNGQLSDEEKPIPCSPEEHGRIALIENVPHMCMACRAFLDPSDRPDGTEPINSEHEWVRILLDGYNRPTSNGTTYSPWETAQAVGYHSRRDPLAEVSYTGQLGSMENVSTVGAFPGAAPVYDPSRLGFVMGYPALNLPAYSIGDLGDVDASNPAVGYGLLWDGEKWSASSLEQQLRLDDLQDVGFGSLGVQNTKLVAAYALTNMVEEPYLAHEDVSTVLAVSAPKDDVAFGSCFLASTPDGHFYPSSVTTLNRTPNDSLAERLDRYMRWEHDGSWHTIDGDGCYEIWFFPTALLETRCIFRKIASIGSKGGWKLDLLATGGLRWNVNGPEGFVGFGWESEVNIVSTNNWHHIAITKQNDFQRLYLDGDLITTQRSQAPWTGDGQFLIGRNDLDDENTLTHHMFKGYFHDLRVTKGRAKYTGGTLTQPTSLEAEIIDTTPNAGDVLMYDGTRWTNASGVQADLSSNSINDLADVDTGSRDPENGDALVWTGEQWEPGIPGIGATWSLDDMTDVSTYYQSPAKLISFDQAQALQFSTQFSSEPSDYGRLTYQGSNNMFVMSQTDPSYHQCPGGDGPLNAQTSWMGVKSQSYAGIKAMNVYIENVFMDCFVIPREYHVAALHYAKCPDRSYDNPPGPGDLTDLVPENFIPCWGVIQDHVDEILEYGALMMLGDCEGTATPGQALTWDGTKWTPSSEVAADVSQNSINDLADVCITNPVTDQALTWNGSCWSAKSVFASILDLEDMNAEAVEHDPDRPFEMEDFRGGINTSTGQSYSPLVDGPQSGDFAGADYNRILNFLGSDAGRGFKWAGGSAKEAFYGGASYLTAMPTQYGTTLLTSPENGTRGASWIELTQNFIRISDSGFTNNGSEGFRLGTDWFIVYEDTRKAFNDYADNQIPHKSAIQSYINTGLGNLNLNNNTLDDLGDVDTAGKQLGYALMWNGVEWIASSGVAADISFSSIGDLSDMEKEENSTDNDNDGWVSFDVPELRTSRPADLFEAGGLKIPNQIGSGWFGFSDIANGAPELFRPSGQLGSILDVFLRAQTDGLVAQGDRGISYTSEPALSDLGLPCVSQVRRIVAQEATDYTALFWMDGNTFVERNYNWELDLTVNTQPNPALWSHFPGEHSFKFLRASADRITWKTTNGAPQQWPANQLWSVEFWMFTESAIPAEDLEYLICAESSEQTQYVEGLQIGLSHGRSKLFFTIDETNMSSDEAPIDGSLFASWDVVHDEWHHVYAAHEGGGRMRLYVDGALVDEFMDGRAFNMAFGISWGGRVPNQSFPNSKRSYYSGYLDDMRITRSWLPYDPDKGSIPVPVEPIGGSAWKATSGSLGALDDVQLNDPVPSNGKVLMYDGVSELWYAGPADAVAYDISSNSINDLSDVNTGNSVPDNDDVLRWDAAGQEWRRSKVDGNGGVRPLNARSITAGYVPNSGNLYAGELFINMSDRKLYALDEAGEAFSFATGDADAQYDRIVGGDF